MRAMNERRGAQSAARHDHGPARGGTDGAQQVDDQIRPGVCRRPPEPPRRGPLASSACTPDEGPRRGSAAGSASIRDPPSRPDRRAVDARSRPRPGASDLSPHCPGISHVPLLRKLHRSLPAARRVDAAADAPRLLLALHAPGLAGAGRAAGGRLRRRPDRGGAVRLCRLDRRSPADDHFRPMLLADYGRTLAVDGLRHRGGAAGDDHPPRSSSSTRRWRPSFTNLVRWQTHRYVLRQSVGFFANDFAGRIASKIIQTGPSLRESVVQVCEAIWFVVGLRDAAPWCCSPISTGG